MRHLFLHLVFIASCAWMLPCAQGKEVFSLLSDSQKETPAPQSLYALHDTQDLCVLIQDAWAQWLGLVNTHPLNTQGIPLDPVKRDKKRPHRPSRARKALWIGTHKKSRNKKAKKSKPLLAA